MKHFYLLLAVVILALPVRAEQVCSVHDGDTFTFCSGRKIRVWGIDAPELKQPYGQESRNYATGLLLGKDTKAKCVGKSYKRQVCKVMVDGSDLGSQMVSHGYAFDCAKYSNGAYSQLEIEAQQKRLGVWQQPNGGLRPWEWRTASKRG